MNPKKQLKPILDPQNEKAKMPDAKKCQKDYIGQFDRDSYKGYGQKLIERFSGTV